MVQILTLGAAHSWLLRLTLYSITLILWISPQLKFDVNDDYTYFSFKVSFFVLESELSNNVYVFLF